MVFDLGEIALYIWFLIFDKLLVKKISIKKKNGYIWIMPKNKKVISMINPNNTLINVFPAV